jgi:hypothetical protein
MSFISYWKFVYKPSMIAGGTVSVKAMYMLSFSIPANSEIPGGNSVTNLFQKSV